MKGGGFTKLEHKEEGKWDGVNLGANADNDAASRLHCF
jgi:hypothetical protein